VFTNCEGGVMKRFFAVIFILVVGGCSYGSEKIKGYMEDPKTILEDPLSVGHQQAMDDLESTYLQKKITYAEYLQKKKQLEDDYQKQAQGRQDIIENAR
jgi:phage shock protein A